MWYYYDQYESELGPFDRFAIIYLINIGVITQDTLIRKDKWKTPKAAISAFKDELFYHNERKGPVDIKDRITLPGGKHARLEDSSFNVYLPNMEYKGGNNRMILIYILCGLAALLLIITAVTKLNTFGIFVLILLSLCCGGGIAFAIMFDVLNAFRHHRMEDYRMDVVRSCVLQCSTPFGIIEWRTTQVNVTLTVIVECSTPFGIIEWRTPS